MSELLVSSDVPRVVLCVCLASNWNAENSNSAFLLFNFFPLLFLSRFISIQYSELIRQIFICAGSAYCWRLLIRRQSVCSLPLFEHAAPIYILTLPWLFNRHTFVLSFSAFSFVKNSFRCVCKCFPTQKKGCAHYILFASQMFPQQYRYAHTCNLNE